MMKRFLFFLLCGFVATQSFSQAKEPVKWSFAAKKINATTYEVQLTAQIEDEWHIYSQSTPDGGPVPTSVSFARNPLLTPSGPTKELGKMEQHFEELFGVNVKQYAGKLTLQQTVVLKAPVKTAVNGTVEYMACNDHECMPPKKQSFSIPLQ